MLNRRSLRRLLRRLDRQFHSLGLLVGTFFFAWSLSPSLLPRIGPTQGVISGLSLAAGYGVGVLLHLIWKSLHLPVPSKPVQRWSQLGAAVACVVFALLFLRQAAEWQNTIRALMGMDEITGIEVTTIGLLAAAVFLSVLLLWRLFHYTFSYLSARLQRFVPSRVSLLAGLTAAFLLFWSIIDGIFFATALRVADRSYQQVDALIEPETERPVASHHTGSAESLIDWNSLGRQGRRFIADTPSATSLARVAGNDAVEPIRVYVGLNSAEDPGQRAALALAELQRVNAFDRSVLIIITPTGTGWIDPASIIPAEYLHRGDVASVAAQYSYMPSPLALMYDGEYGVDTARALFQTIYRHWTTLPADNRPRLYLLGLSLGALNSDQSFDFYDIIDDPFHGALWSGPPFRSETWRDVTQRRDPGSPAWLPVFRNGAVVRFANQHGGLERPPASWGNFRIAYLQYASDPITFFEPQSLYREPAWMRDPRGHDVSPELRWFPIVTMLQLVADIATGSAPRGFGHEYAAEHYHDAWLALTEPSGWTPQALSTLRRLHQQAR